MSFIGGGMGAGPASGLRFAQTRGRIQGSPVQGVNYPSPFFDIAHTYYPVTVKQMFRWCRYYFLTNPLINTVAFKLSEYPITDIIFDHADSKVVRRWTEYFQDHLRYRAFQVESGLDYHVYGNSLVSVGFPFKKFLYCQSCQFREEAAKIRPNWVFTNFAFRLSCPKCGQVGDAVAKDFYFKNASGVKTIRWNPEDVEISYNDITGEYTHFYTIPAVVRNDVVIGRKDIVEGVPQVFIQALREQKGVIFSKDNIFHMRRPTIATQDRGWGLPLLLPVLKDTFYLQIMKKAQEAILVEHIVPLRVLFPQPGSGTSDPYTSINLVDWRDHVAAEIARWRQDNNYIPILPLPIGQETIGGDGKSLLMTQEIQTWSEQIINGMQVPIEFIKGGMQYSGTAVSMRMLENQFLGYLIRQKQLARFIMKNVAGFLGWPEASLRFKPFKMADDLQRKAYLFQLNQAQKISDKTLLADADLDQEEENKIMLAGNASRTQALEAQQLAMATIQGKAQLIMAKYQVKAQQEAQTAMAAPAAAGEAGGPEQAGAQGTPGGQAGGPGDGLPVDLQSGGGQANGQGGPPAMELQPEFMQAVQSPLQGSQKMSQPDGKQNLNVDLPSMAMSEAQRIAILDPQQQTLAIQNLRTQSPSYADLVLQMLRQVQPTGSSPPGEASKPLPEQRAPRRSAALI
jgi:hypothetical protein